MSGGKQARVVVVGSANADIVVTAQRLPHPGETVPGNGLEVLPGGKGLNQAVAAALDGAHVQFVGAVGRDERGALLEATLTDAGVDTATLRQVSTQTGTAVVTVDASGENAIVVVPGANGTLTDLGTLEAAVVAEADVVVVQLELPVAGVAAALDIATRTGSLSVLTPAPVPPPEQLARLGRVGLLVPNAREAAELTGRDDPVAAAQDLLDIAETVVVTLGRGGAVAVTARAEPLHVPAVPAVPVDTTGAGDVFAGVLATALARGMPLAKAVRRAATAASLSIGRRGAAASAPTRAETDDLLAGHAPEPAV